MSLGKRVLPASHAGSWYPTGNSLKSMLEKAFSNVNIPEMSGKTKAIIVPHAGYVYCLQTAAHSFKTIDTSQYSRVVILGPSHRLYVTKCTIADADFFETPTGPIPFDRETADKLINDYPKLFTGLNIEKAQIEHSLEMECPILKYIFGEKQFSVIPIMVGAISDKGTQEVANALSPIISDPQTLLVISSDFCHWGMDFEYTYLPSGYSVPWKGIEKLDHDAMDAISTGNHQTFADFIKRTGDTICGECPIRIAMQAIPKPYQVHWLNYSQSEKITSSRGTSVSYSAGVFSI